MQRHLWEGVAAMNVLDLSGESSTASVLLPFAREELLCRAVGEGATPVLHLWRHRKAFVVGLRDRELPHAAEAIRDLEREGYQVAVRHSGGAAVPLDEGVLNVSLIMPKAAGAVHFHADFERYYDWLSESLRRTGYPFPAEKGEIAGSYCPGDYDVSVNGLKFCGIAQRRQTRAHIVHGFIVVEGDAAARAERVRRFYDTASAGGKAGDGYPIVRPDTMTSLGAWGSPLTCTDLRDALFGTLLADGIRLKSADPELIGQDDLDAMTQQLLKRYAKK